MRIILVDNSFIDVHLSQRIPDKFSFHWECADRSETLYRYDNFPDKKWQSVPTYPHHFHDGSQDTVKSSPFPLSIIDGFRAFMEFVKEKI
ncbi:MAG: toxin-antitoxin system TumE family protein [Candidatus Scalindua sp.]